MDVGIVGAGRIGETLARLLVGAGHAVTLSNSRGPETLRDLVADLGPLAHPGTVEETVQSSELVVLALPFRNRESLPNGDLFAGRIVVDATNPYTESLEVMDLPRTSSEYVAEQLPGARVVKAFNTLGWETLRDAAGRTDEDRLAVFVAGDDPRAKAVVSRLVDDVGFAPVDAGSLVEGGARQQPGGPLFGLTLTEREARARLVPE